MTDTVITHPTGPDDSHLKAFGCGLSGAHRTGKTTLAARLAEKNEIPFVQTSMSALANRMGIKIGLDMPYDQRRALQDAALIMFEEEYDKHGAGRIFITDRTPFDLAAYAITAWHPSLTKSPDDDDWTWDYVKRCLDLANAYFFHLTVIQPSTIPFVQAEQKGENIKVYMEALNATIIGLAMQEDFFGNVHILPRQTTDLMERSAAVAKDFSDCLGTYADHLRNSLSRQ